MEYENSTYTEITPIFFFVVWCLRWHNHLDPAIKKDTWTDEEESTLTYYHQIYGNKWAEIARFLPGR